MEEDTHTLKPRHIENQNVVHRLERRRISSGAPGAHWYRVRCFHQNLFPNFTVVNVEKPPCFLRKFSPDGRCFIAFSADQTSLEVKKQHQNLQKRARVANFGYPPSPPPDLWISRLPSSSRPAERSRGGNASDRQRPVLPQRSGAPIWALFLSTPRHQRGLKRGAPEPGMQPVHRRLPLRHSRLGRVRPRGAAALLLWGNGAGKPLDPIGPNSPGLVASSRCIGTMSRLPPTPGRRWRTTRSTLSTFTRAGWVTPGPSSVTRSSCPTTKACTSTGTFWLFSQSSSKPSTCSRWEEPPRLTLVWKRAG